MRKKLIYFVLIFACIINNFNVRYADDILDEDYQVYDIDDIIETSARADEECLILNSRIAMAFDRKSNKVIWGKDENKRTAMASTTKIMTSIIVAEQSNLDDIVEISSKAGGTGGSRLGLKKGDKVSMKDLLYGLMLKSGNDAAVAIAEHIAGNVNSFAELMNLKAEQLGLQNTHFITPHGLDDPDHYTTAYELAKITDYALENKIIAKVVATKYYTVNINGYPKDISNTNELLGNLEGVNGVKTGFTNNAGRCLVTSVDRNGFNIITIVLQADTKKDRTKDSIKLIEYIYKYYQEVNVKDIVEKEFKNWCYVNKKRININKAKNLNIEINFNDLQNDIIVVKKEDIYNIKIDINVIYELEAPVLKNTIIGSLKVKVKDNIIDVEDVYVVDDVNKKDVWDYFFECICALGSLERY